MFKSKRSIILIAIMLASILTLTACGGSSKGENDLVVAQVSDATTLDPQRSNDQPSGRVFRHIYDNLVVFNNDMELVPELATEWNQIDDLTWEFKLRDDVVFHNGEKFTADDVKYTIDRHQESPEVGHLLAAIDEVEVVDEHTVLIKTLKPFAALLPHLSHNSVGILNEKAVTEAGEDYGQNPVGTGPFKFVSWDTGDSIVLEKNEEFFGPEVKIDSITFNIIPEATNRVIALETGEADIAYEIDPIDKQTVIDNEDLEYIQAPAFSFQYMGMNTNKEPFTDVKVRQAINYAINVEEIIEVVLEGAAERANTPLQANVPGSNQDIKGYDYDPEKAKELLAEAGFPDGFSTTLWTNDNPVRGRVAELIQGQLKNVGIDVKLENLEWGAYLDRTSAGEQDMYMLGWSLSTGDADYGLGSLFHSDNLGTGGNRSFYVSKDVDELLDRGAVEKDPETRNEIYKEAQAIIMDDVPIAPLYFDSYSAGIQKYVKGFTIHPAGHIMLDTVYFER